MKIGPKRRVVQGILSECLSRIRKFGEYEEHEFAGYVHDLPGMLRGWAEQLDTGAIDVAACPELPECEGYALWAENYDESEGNPVIAGEEEIIHELIGDVQGLRILDVGCGTGRHAISLSAQEGDVTAIDPTPEMLERARNKAAMEGVKVTFRQGSVNDLDPALGEFDLVLCCLVLSHVSDLRGAVARIASHVRPGGRVIVSDFHPFNILLGCRTSCVKDGQKYVLPNFLHLPSDYFTALKKSGLDVVEYYEKGYDVKFPCLPMTLIIVAQRSET